MYMSSTNYAPGDFIQITHEKRNGDEEKRKGNYYKIEAVGENDYHLLRVEENGSPSTPEDSFKIDIKSVNNQPKFSLYTPSTNSSPSKKKDTQSKIKESKSKGGKSKHISRKTRKSNKRVKSMKKY